MSLASQQNIQAQQIGQLPVINSKTGLEFTIKYRPLFEGKRNILEFLPMWHQPYEDNAEEQRYVCARQTGKTSKIANKLAELATSIPNSWQVYCTYEDESRKTFVGAKYRQSVYGGKDNFLAKFVNGKTLGSMNHMDFLNGSKQDFVTHNHDFTHFEGKSSDHNFLDEWQYLNMAAYARLNETQSWTQGSNTFAGIGGYIGTKHHKGWLESNQMEWIYDNVKWRDGLKFLGYNCEKLLPDEFTIGRSRLVWGNYMKPLMKGKWISQGNSDSPIHGYHMGQEIFPHIPLLEIDAMQKYQISIKNSLQWKKKDYSYDDYMRHALAKFIKGAAKPFLREDIEKLFDKSSGLTPANLIDKSKGPILAGIDLGGGNKAYTIIWIIQRLHPTAPIFKTIYVRRIKEKDVEKQADMLIDLINAYEVDMVGIDAGGGTRQVQKLQDTFGPRVVRINYYPQGRPEFPLPKEDEIDQLRYDNRYMIDRTYAIEQLRDLMTRYHVQGQHTFPRLIIPYNINLPGFTDTNNDWLIDNFEAIEGVMVLRKGRETMVYEHDETEPDDAVHALVYAFVAHLLKNDSSGWFKTL